MAFFSHLSILLLFENISGKSVAAKPLTVNSKHAGHGSPSQIPEVQALSYADIARFRELHSDPSYCVAKGIRTETICASQSRQTGTTEHMNSTLETGACTVLWLVGSNVDSCIMLFCVRYFSRIFGILPLTPALLHISLCLVLLRDQTRCFRVPGIWS